MSKRNSKRKKRRRSTQELAPISEQRYAQPVDDEEEISIQPEGGVLRVNTGSLSIPTEIEAEATSRKASGANIVVLVIVTLMLAFIGIIAWFISSQ